MPTPPPPPLPPQPPEAPVYYPPPAPHKSNTVAIVIGVLLACGLLFGGCMLAILLPSLSRAREVANRVKCMSNLRQIGNGLAMYANENNGIYPSSLGILTTEELAMGTFVCPASNDSPATPGADTKASAANVESGGHLSYIYVGKGLTRSTVKPTTVLVYEPLGNHRNQGMNVLYGDSHAEWLNSQEANAVMAELQAGHNPPQLRN